MCTLGDAAALGEGMGFPKTRHLENREVQVVPSRGLLSFVAFLFADIYKYCSQSRRQGDGPQAGIRATSGGSTKGSSKTST